jgi:glycosyltransferase involved in cell wall biosynthesis
LTDSPLGILVLSPIEPYPVTGGWQTVIYNDIKYLAARGHRMDLLALTYDRSRDPRDLSDIAEAEYFPIKKPPKWLQVSANFGRALPYTIVRHHDARLLKRATELVRDGSIDVVLVEDVVMGRYAGLLKQTADVPAFLRGHNVSTVVCQRFYESQRNPILRYLGQRQYEKFARYESAVLATFDGVSQISPSDVAEAGRLNPRVAQEVLLSGVDLDYFAVAPFEGRDENVIVHVGTLDGITKLPAMVWFFDKVLPRIKVERPQARLELAGRMPPCRLRQLQRSDLIVHGEVADVRPFLAKGGAFIAPQFVGSGIRIKILHAMAAGNAIVATTVACEGLPVTDGEEIFIADDEASFADRVGRLLADASLREAMGRRARRMVEERFGWARIAEELETHLRDAIRRCCSKAASIRKGMGTW